MNQTKTNKAVKVLHSARQIKEQVSKRVIFGQGIETVSFLNVSAILKLSKA